jgi:hypothetical protein
MEYIVGHMDIKLNYNIGRKMWLIYMSTRISSISACIVALIALFTGFLSWVIQLCRVNLEVPFDYLGDALLGDTLTIVTSMLILRQLNISHKPSENGGLLYTYLPYHLLRRLLHPGVSVNFILQPVILHMDENIKVMNRIKMTYLIKITVKAIGAYIGARLTFKTSRLILGAIS